MDNNAPSMLKATVIGGVVAGVASAIPLVGCLNMACCALVIGGGFLASYLYAQDCGKAGAPFTPGTGATTGLIAGLFFGLSFTMIGALRVLTGLSPDPEETMAQLEESMQPLIDSGVSPEDIDAALGLLEKFSGVSLISVLFSFLLWLLIGAVFSTLGGLLGGAVFKSEAPAPPSPPPADPA